VDSKLRWSSHIARAAEKGSAQLEALSRLVGSTWGLTFARARTLYTAVIRPTITHACGIWAGGKKGEGLQERTLRPLITLQNKCLRRITGAYKRTPVAALEKDTNIPPIQLYTRAQAYKYTLNSDQSTAEAAIRQLCEQIGHQNRPSRRRRQQRARPTPQEALAAQAGKARAKEDREENQRQAAGRSEGRTGRRGTNDWLESWHRKLWRERWEKAGRGKTEPTWCTLWETWGKQLFDGLTRPECTIATLLRTEVIGLNAFLVRVGVPNVQPACPCRAARQTPKRVVVSCPNHSQGRPERQLEAGTTDYVELLTTQQGLKAVTKWFLRQDILQQFKWARETALRPAHARTWRELTPLPK